MTIVFSSYSLSNYSEFIYSSPYYNFNNTIFIKKVTSSYTVSKEITLATILNKRIDSLILVTSSDIPLVS